MIVYKYLSPSRVDVLQDGLIRFTQSAAVNDPFETTPNMQQLARSFRTYALSKIESAQYDSVVNEIIDRSRIRSLVQQHIEEFLRIHSNNYAILSLSKTNNNLLMWAHYCDSHRGFVLGFDSTHEFFHTRRFKAFSPLADVHYSSERPIMPAPEIWDGSPEKLARDVDLEDLAELVFYTKSEDWEYEQEVRMIANPEVADRRFKTLDGQDLCLYKFPAECLKELILGIRMPRDQRLQIVKLVRERYAEVRFFEARLSDEKFDLDLVPFD